MTTIELLQVIGVGALLGAVGQAIRAIIGLKKAHQDIVSARALGRADPPGASFNLTLLLLTLVVGAVAGILSVLTLGVGPGEIDNKTILAIIAAGYAGTDFIEGIVRKVDPPADSNRQVKPAPSGPAPAVTPRSPS